MLFDEKDKIHLKNLMEVIRDKTTYGDLDCMGISKTYKAFEWLQHLESKMEAVKEVERTNSDLREALENETEGLRQHNEELELEIAELKKPKRRTRKKKA
jgi:protein subunit release factor A